MTPKYRLLTEQEVAEWYQISIARLQGMRYKPGRDPIPVTKIGGAVRYREDLLLQWLERNTAHGETMAQAQ